MKRILVLLMSMLSAILLSACGTDTEAICYICNESYSTGTNFCQNCGAKLSVSSEELIEEHEEETIDYSNFGFQNNYSLTEWVTIGSYDFSSEEPYVQISKTLTRTLYSPELYVLNFANGHIESRTFGIYGQYTGVREEGNLEGLYPYTIVSNNLLSLDSATLEIKSVEVENNIPIISVELEAEEYYHDYKLPTTAWFIPVEFIDFEYEPEVGQQDRGDYWGTKDTYVRYRIKKELIE